MKKNCYLALALIGIGMAACSHRESVTADYQVIPLPHEIAAGGGEGFKLTGSTLIAYPQTDSVLHKNAELLAGYLAQLTGEELRISDDTTATDAIVLKAGLADSNPEAYRITVSPSRIIIDGASAAGNFYGIQTLRKSIPEAGDHDVLFPAVDINDHPRFGYRGAHFDVVRHFFPVEDVKAFIDMIALHNINTLHWHLTDDQGWRLEIKKYPRLTEVGSRRDGTCVGRDFSTSDSIPYGGFFTQDEAREIVRYAADRHITVIPEVDLPGHMVAALTAYPSLGCTGGPYKVWQRWGVSEDLLCAGNDSIYTFLADVLNEVMDIFPSEYIHVGGDECPKVRWEACPKCQARIRELGLKTDAHSTKEAKLQSYVMGRANDILAARGRKMIGWDEIMEGGLAPGAVIMSWRGADGGLKAARLGHDAIMTPNDYFYFDYYQTLNRDSEPLAIGGYVPLEKVYSFTPVPDSFSDEEGAHIKGVQANLWTEYISTFDYVQYMELPRMAALAEVQWCDEAAKDYRGFTSRLPRLMRHYDAAGYRYARHVFDVSAQMTPATVSRGVVVKLSTIDDAPIHYTLDGSEPETDSPLFTDSIVIDRPAHIKAVAVRPDRLSRVYFDSVTVNKATGRPVEFAYPPQPRYADGAGAKLTNGLFGSSSFADGAWVGFQGVPMVATVDLGAPELISSARVSTLIDVEHWVFDATDMTVEVSSDGKSFKRMASEDYPLSKVDYQKILWHVLSFHPVEARYVRITVNPVKSIPEWHNGHGQPAFIFIDEIVVD